MAESADTEMSDLNCEDNENDSESDSDSFSDDENMSDNEEEVAQKITYLQEQIKTNPYCYDPHIELIKLLRKEGELEQLRVAREHMSKIFPLTEDLWLDWIEDEKKLAVSEAERDTIIKLFERAVVDYVSVEVWLEYAQYSIGQMDMKNTVNNVRAIFERAITAVGLHVVKGSVIWEAYREFENAMLITMQQHTEDGQGCSKSEEIEQQQKRIMNLFRRQLSIPLLDMKKTYEELTEWLKGKEIDSTIRPLYEKALAKLQKLQAYEDELLSNTKHRLAAFEDYISYELKENEPARVQCIFERALVENCLIPSLWKRYTDYLESKLKIDSISLPVFERAVRNCPWSVELWENYILAMERHKQPHEKIKELVDRALGAGFTTAPEFRQLWMIYLDYLRRRINWSREHKPELKELQSTFLRAHNHLVECFGKEADPSGTILRYWARIEAYYCKNVEKMRELWKEIMILGNSHSAEYWLEYASLERSCGDSHHLRKLYQKALQMVDNWPEMIGEAWINFERDEGTLDQWETAVAKYNSRILIIQEKRKKENEKNQQRQEEHTKSSENTPPKFDRSSLKRKILQKESNAKRKREESLKACTSIDKEGFKIPQVPSSGGGGKWENLSASVQPSSSSSLSSSSSSSSSSSEQKDSRTLSHGEAITHDSSKDDLTAFLSNLDYSVKEEDIRQMFSSVGEIHSLRLVRDYKGRSKGYSYLQFKTRESQQAALKMDRQLLNGRPVFVSPCEDKKTSNTQKKFKYTIGLEKNKLFIRGLPFSSTKDDVIAMFQPFGELQDVRIVTYRNGHSKGLAYVDFKDETAAAIALVKLDGTKIGSHMISVALSNPPDRGKQSSQQQMNQNIPSLGGGTKDVGTRGRGRTQVILIPRAVKLQSSSPHVKSSNGSLNGSENGQSTRENPAPKTNEEFRNMLLNK